MTRRAIVALLLYAVLVGSALTSLYDPLTWYRLDPWWIIPGLGSVVVLGAHLGVGAGVARPYVLWCPVVFTLAVAVDDPGVEGDPVLFLVVVLLPILLAATALGWGLAATAGRGWLLIAGGAFLLASVPFVEAAKETIDRADAPHVPASVQARLPTGLGGLCPDWVPPEQKRGLRQSAEVLLSELNRHPDWLVTQGASLEEEGTEITVHDLGEVSLRELETADESQMSAENCAPNLQDRLREAL